MRRTCAVCLLLVGLLAIRLPAASPQVEDLRKEVENLRKDIAAREDTRPWAQSTVPVHL